jgi:molybdopterin biosynthesis enzyme MoaB
MPTADSSASKEIVTAALLLVIRWQDPVRPQQGPEHRLYEEHLTALGIDLEEVRVVGDEETAIVDALNALRRRCTYVFTTGGIGPTHGDITADCVAKAFGVSMTPIRARSPSCANG